MRVWSGRWGASRPARGAIEGVPRVSIRARLRGWLASLHDIRFGSPPPQPRPTRSIARHPFDHSGVAVRLATPSTTPPRTIGRDGIAQAAASRGSTRLSGTPVRLGRAARLLAARLRHVMRGSGARCATSTGERNQSQHARSPGASTFQRCARSKSGDGGREPKRISWSDASDPHQRDCSARTSSVVASRFTARAAAAYRCRLTTGNSSQDKCRAS